MQQLLLAGSGELKKKHDIVALEGEGSMKSSPSYMTPSKPISQTWSKLQGLVCLSLGFTGFGLRPWPKPILSLLKLIV